MKFNQNLARKILLYVENALGERSTKNSKRNQNVDNEFLSSGDIYLDQYFKDSNEQDFSYALETLFYNKYFDCCSVKYDVCGNLDFFIIKNIDEKAKKLMNNIRKDEIWNYVKNCAERVTEGASMQVLSASAEYYQTSKRQEEFYEYQRGKDQTSEPDIVRQILLYLEKKLNYKGDDNHFPKKHKMLSGLEIFSDDTFRIFKEEQFSIAFSMLCEEQYLKSFPLNPSKMHDGNFDYHEYFIITILPKGIELLSNIRKEDDWNEIKSKALGKTGKTSLAELSAIANKVIYDCIINEVKWAKI